MKSKHLTLSERITIQEMLERRESLRSIAARLNKSVSSISREIKRNRYKQSKKNLFIECTKIKSCKITHACGDNDCRRYCSNCIEVCNSSRCPEYDPDICYYHTHAPFVCNGCPSERKNICHQERYYYDAKLAQVTYEKTLTDSRSGVSLSAADMELIDSVVSPLLLNGHSIQSIFINHKNELPCSMRTLYNYVDSCYLTARNIDMPRKVRFKKRYRHDKNARSMQTFCEGRTYSEFKEFIQKNPDISICEMDTVVGTVESKKVLLTLYIRNCSFMMAVLLPNKSQHSVIRALNNISNRVGVAEFRRVFGTILTDRGTEFGNPYALECDEYGEIKTRVFYCDSYCSWQKGSIEKNHEFIRYIIPQGRSFDALRQSDVDLMINHINSYPRTSLNNNTPYQVAELLIGKEFLEKLGYYAIPVDEVILKPSLLKKNRK